MIRKSDVSDSVAIANIYNHYIKNTNDIEGTPLYEVGYHHETGVKKPKTQEQLNSEEIAELNNWLDLRRNIEHPDKASKQARLLELLG